MNELEKIRNSGVFQGVLAIGIFSAAFYFLFLRGNKAYSQESPPEETNDGRKLFFGEDGNPQNYVRGYEAPDTIDELDFVNGQLMIISKPDTNIFNGLPQKGMVSVYRDGDNLVYDGSINGKTDNYKAKYLDIKDKIVLPKKPSNFN